MASAVLLLALVALTEAHMPAFAGSTSRESPADLGDITKNSWAISGELSPGEVKHFSFTVASATTPTSKETE